MGFIINYDITRTDNSVPIRIHWLCGTKCLFNLWKLIVAQSKIPCLSTSLKVTSYCAGLSMLCVIYTQYMILKHKERQFRCRVVTEICTGRNVIISPVSARQAFGPSPKFIFMYVSRTPQKPDFLLFLSEWGSIHLQSGDYVSSGGKLPWSVSRHSPGMRRDRLRKTMQNVSQDSR
jgi:hypothetical protein